LESRVRYEGGEKKGNISPRLQNGTQSEKTKRLQPSFRKPDRASVATNFLEGGERGKKKDGTKPGHKNKEELFEGEA